MRMNNLSRQRTRRAHIHIHCFLQNHSSIDSLPFTLINKQVVKKKRSVNRTHFYLDCTYNYLQVYEKEKEILIKGS